MTVIDVGMSYYEYVATSLDTYYNYLMDQLDCGYSGPSYPEVDYEYPDVIFSSYESDYDFGYGSDGWIEYPDYIGDIPIGMYQE